MIWGSSTFRNLLPLVVVNGSMRGFHCAKMLDKYLLRGLDKKGMANCVFHPTENVRDQQH